MVAVNSKTDQPGLPFRSDSYIEEKLLEVEPKLSWVRLFTSSHHVVTGMVFAQLP